MHRKLFLRDLKIREQKSLRTLLKRSGTVKRGRNVRGRFLVKKQVDKEA